MAFLDETPQWEEGIYQFEETDDVQGGAEGIDNLPTRQLGNRTAYLKEQLENKTEQATETKKGVVELADEDEAEAGDDNQKAMTAKRVHDVLSAFGIGCQVGYAPILDDINRFDIPTGDYQTTGSTLGDIPTNRTQNSVSVYAGTSRIFQVIRSVDEDVYFRVGQDPAWEPWRVVYTSASPAASETVRSVVKFATQDETDDGSDDTVAVTPKKMRWGFSASLGYSGYLAFPTWMGGFILQWKTYTSGSTGNSGVDPITFPITFPTTCFGVIGTDRANTETDINTVAFASITQQGANLVWRNDSGGTVGLGTVFYIAIGN